MTRKHLFVLFACLFVTMIGLGITLPVLPFYVERLAISGDTSRQPVALQVGLLTGVYALGQLFFAPFWGRWSDRMGRRPLLLIGIAGYAIGQVLFGLATSLPLLYAARILGGALSAAILPVSAAYVADLTAEKDRSRGMAWLGTATSLGFVVGPALGGILSRRNLHLRVKYAHLMIDSFSVPFFAAAVLGLLVLAVALRWLPESLPSSLSPLPSKQEQRDWRSVVQSLRPLLGMVLIGQFALATFEAIFALYAQAVFHYGPARVGAGFVVCGLVMSVFQAGVVGLLARRVKEIYQIAAGFGAMGMSLALFTTIRAASFVFALVGLLAFGSALISPNLAALISKHGGSRRVGESLGVQNAANSLAQAAGPLLGSALYVWKADAPYLLAAALSFVTALFLLWHLWRGKQETGGMAGAHGILT